MQFSVLSQLNTISRNLPKYEVHMFNKPEICVKMENVGLQKPGTNTTALQETFKNIFI